MSNGEIDRPCIVELNDAAIRIARGTEELARSPGYAAFVRGKLEVGVAGHAHAWQVPRHATNRFWLDLNTAPLAHFGKRVRHAADLAYLHLQHLRDTAAGHANTAIFVVPASYQRTQLALLLGVARAAGIAVSALVDSGAAVGATLPPGDYCYIEATLHQCVVSRVRVDTERAVREHTEIVSGAGLVHFEQRIIAAVVDAFLSRSRFDPLHDAATEQLLHTQLPAWLALLGEHPEIALTIEYRGTRHETRLQRDAVLAATASLTRQLAQRVGTGTVVLDYRLGELPGVANTWRTARVLPQTAVFAGCTSNPDLRDLRPDEGMSLRTTLAVTGSILPDTSLQRSSRAPALDDVPTHLLVRHTAHSIASAPLFLAAHGGVQRARTPDAVCMLHYDAGGAFLEPYPGAHIAVNGRAVNESTALTTGDHITVAGATNLFIPIKVQAPDAV